MDIIYCSLFCATENALREYIDKRSIEGGNCTRKVLTDLGDLMGEEAPQFRPLTEEELAVVNATVKQLMEITYGENGTIQPVHTVPMEFLDYHVRLWCHDQRMLVLKTGSRARNCFFKRASVSAARMACLLYYLWGEDATKQKHVIRFYRFMATYIVDGLLSRWGRQYEQMHQNDDGDDSVKVSLYDQLPDRFSRDQLRELILKLDLSTPARIFISKWKRAKLIYESPETKGIYVKNY